MSELYRAIAGSPITYLTADISANQTTISIADDSALPDGPNICTIGYGENLETIKYETKSNGVLQNVTRGIEGTPRAWPAGTEVARFFTAYDQNAIIENFNSHLAESVSHLSVITRDLSIGGVQSVTLPFKAKTLIGYAFLTNGQSECKGFWDENGTQRVVVTKGHDGNRIGRTRFISLDTSSTDTANGTIQNVTNAGFEINWGSVGSPSGTATIYILALTHGGA